MNHTTNRAEQFIGRRSELDALAAAYDRVAGGGGPECTVILGDSGMGKTRLVQEFYRELRQRQDSKDYWPSPQTIRGENVWVVPDFSDADVARHFRSFYVDDRPLPYLWWGLRASDPGDRRHVFSGIDAARATLQPHLDALSVTQRHSSNDGSRLSPAQWLKQKALVAGRWVTKEALEGIGAKPVMTFFDVLASFEAQRKAEEDAQFRESAAFETMVQGLDRQQGDLWSKTVRDLVQVMTSRTGVAGVPVVLIIDDGQFCCSDRDESIPRFADDLWRAAHEASLPLLMVVTHWSGDWNRLAADDDRSLASKLILRCPPLKRTELRLTGGDDLTALINAALPELSPEDANYLRTQAEGSPRILKELVQKVCDSPYWMEDNQLSADAKSEIATHHGEVDKWIRERILRHADPRVRQALALAARQGMEFLVPMVEEAAAELKLDLIPAAPALDQAETNLCAISATNDVEAMFANRAYWNCSRELLGKATPSAVKVGAALSRAAAALQADPLRWRALAPHQQLAVNQMVINVSQEVAP